ncbi:MAG: hypothetical protein GY811_20695 [Myxococcales bacterium]|nr:hypothetical protein [Myxococcales bacterium]
MSARTLLLSASRCISSIVLVAAILLRTSGAEAQERPRDRNLILAGMAMGIPTYTLGVALHEGSHALAGKALGARVTDYSLVPGFHPRTGTFYFGYVTVFGLKNDRQRAMFLLAPKLTDSILLGGFSALYGFDALPNNAYANTAFLVLATGFWVDFSKDIFSFSDKNDTIKIYNMLGLDSELRRVAVRLVHAGLSFAMGYSIYQGYRDLFGRDVEASQSGIGTAIYMPMWDTSF